MCLLPTMTQRYLTSRYRFSEWICILTLLHLAVGYVSAQSQDYLNAQHAEQISALTKRVERIEGRIDYVLWGIAAVVGTQLLNMRNQRQYAQRRRATDDPNDER